MEGQSKSRQVILHAGFPKTATTAIQNAFFSQRHSLIENCGILYPGQEANHTNALCTAFLDDPRNHITNKMRGDLDLEDLKRRGQSILRGFEQEIAAADPDTVLFSAEGLSNLDWTELKRFGAWVSGFASELSVLYIVRSPVSYLTSVMQQHLKHGDVLEAMLDAPPVPNYAGKLKAAIRAFDRDRVEVRTFEDACRHPDGVVGFFVDWLNLSDKKTGDAILAAQNFDNESLSHFAALILSSLNRQRPAIVNGKKGARRTLNEVAIIGKIGGEKFWLPADLMRGVLVRSQPDIDWLKTEFDITEYDENSDVTEEDHFDIPDETIDSLALVLSNLINDRHVNSLINRAKTLHSQGTKTDVYALAQDICRITPDRQLPRFMQDIVDADQGV